MLFGEPKLNSRRLQSDLLSHSWAYQLSVGHSKLVSEAISLTLALNNPRNTFLGNDASTFVYKDIFSRIYRHLGEADTTELVCATCFRDE